MLADARTSRSFVRPGDEELFTVAEEDEDADSDDDRTAKPLPKPADPGWSDDDDDDTTPRNNARAALMGNASAARSWVNVRSVDDQDGVLDEPEGDGNSRRSGLSTKAGIILVGSPLWAAPCPPFLK